MEERAAISHIAALAQNLRLGVPPSEPTLPSPCALCNDLKCERSYESMTVGQLLVSAERKCPGCGLLLDSLAKFGADLKSFEENVYVKSTQTNDKPAFHKVGMGKLDVEIFTLPDQPASFPALMPGTDVSGNTGSDKSIANIIRWMKICSDGHFEGAVCPQNLNVPLPTLLLDVSDMGSDTVRLVDTTGQRGYYACLSHCWGLNPLLRTLKANIPDHKAGIKFELLPKTFKDAVKIVQALQIPYIWIDSLCIVQDDNAFWEKEAALMANIYQNGRVTIAASNGTGSADGCFMESSRFISKEVSSEDQKGNVYRARARRSIEHGRWPLLARGWVYQERLLSPRVIHFGHAEVVWECFEATECECSRSKDHDFQWIDFSFGKKNIYQVWTLGNRTSSIDMPLDFWADQWRAMVETYSRLNLTYGRDVFPALSGAAKQIQLHRNSKYVAGLWEDTLAVDLLWNSTDPQMPRPDEWHAPTWSWALVFGHPSASTRIYASGAEYSALQFGNKIKEVHVKVDEVSCTAAGSDPTGKIDSAHISLTGAVIPAAIQYPFGEDMIHTFHIVGDDRGDDEYSGSFHADYRLQTPGRGYVAGGTPLHCLKIATAQTGEKVETSYLVLHCIDEASQTFERIGIWQYRYSPADEPGGRYLPLESVVTVKIV